MAKEYFPQIGKIPFEGTASKNVLAFHYYEPERVVMGKKMKDWMRFAMAWWHTLGQASGDPFGGQTRSYEWAELRDRNFYTRFCPQRIKSGIRKTASASLFGLTLDNRVTKKVVVM